MARPKKVIDENKLTKFLKENPDDLWDWVYKNDAKGLFIRAAESLDMDVVKLKDWVYVSSKIRNKLRSRIKGQLADHIIQNFDLMSMLPFTIEQLADHLISNGLDVNDFKNTHIDHIIPKSSFRFKSFSDKSFLECWSLNNLRPLDAKENLRKGRSIGKNGKTDKTD